MTPLWESFPDPAYYDMWCVRRVGERIAIQRDRYADALRQIAAMGLRPIEHGNAVEYERNNAVRLAVKALGVEAIALDRDGEPVDPGIPIHPTAAEPTP